MEFHSIMKENEKIEIKYELSVPILFRIMLTIIALWLFAQIIIEFQNLGNIINTQKNINNLSDQSNSEILVEYIFGIIINICIECSLILSCFIKVVKKETYFYTNTNNINHIPKYIIDVTETDTNIEKLTIEGDEKFLLCKKCGFQLFEDDVICPNCKEPRNNKKNFDQ